ncbi:MAG: hypothetical protein DRR11_20140 [Gammaproteobacteria bacterium]|nr:MAG: hypothetical protein DRR11_20140 [Gammaproteobacteria bacterium]
MYARLILVLVMALIAGIGCNAVANDEPELPDAELLEFLGSWEGEDNEWQEFFDSLPAIINETSSVDKQNGQDKQENGR